MKKEDRHRSDDDLKKALVGYRSEPSEKLWGHIQKNIPQTKTPWYRKWYQKPAFYISTGAMLLVAGVFLNRSDKDIIVNETIKQIDSTESFVVEAGETTLNLSINDFLKDQQEIKLKEQPKHQVTESSEKASEAPVLFIANGSFEAHTPIPHKNDGKIAKEPWVKFSHVHHWETGGIPDYYHPRNNRPSMWNNTPKSAHGIVDAKDGQAMIGLVAHSDSGYREYKYTELQAPMIKDVWYSIEFYVVKGTHGAPIQNIGTYFTDAPINYESYKKGDMPIDTAHYACTDQYVYSGDFYEGGWRKINLSYKAKGDEKYLYLGSMLPIDQVKKGHEPKERVADKEEKAKKTDRRRVKGNYSYYFFDKVYIGKAEKQEFVEEVEVLLFK